MAIAQDFIRMLRPCQSFSGYSQDAIFVNNKYLTDALGLELICKVNLKKPEIPDMIIF